MTELRHALGFTLLVTAGASACLTPSAVTCDDGRVCAAGSVCVAGGCADPDDVAACDGKDEGASCERDGEPAGRCRGGVCEVAFCGDGVVDPDEACDDGDTLSGDGCRADCQSDELCGNGTTDGAVGEFCDDGNSLSGDGCASRCVLEVDAWREVPLAAMPGRTAAAFAHDLGRDAVITFGGRDIGGSPLDDTWALRGGRWARVESAVSPPAVYEAAMAYDEAGARMVLWGGGGLFVASDETWILDGQGWQRLPTAHGPAPSAAAKMAYDRARERLVLYVPRGSYAEPDVVSETWELVDEDWVLVEASLAPRRYDAAIAYHAARERVVLVAGTDTLTTYGDSFEFDGTSWSGLDVGGGGGPVPASPISPRTNTAMAYDARLETLVLVGGIDSFSPFDAGHDDAYLLGPSGQWTAPALYELDGQSHRMHAMAYDPRAGKVVLYSGLFGGDGAGLSDATWHVDVASDASEQVIPAAPAGPSARIGPALAAFPPTGELIMAGGQPVQEGPDPQTWAYTAGTWRVVDQDAPNGAAGAGAAMAYDPIGQRLVMLLPTGQWHAFDGASWSALVLADEGPAMRAFPSLVYDAVREELVAITGPVDATHVETWALRGDLPVLLDADGGPSQRAHAAAAFDVHSGRVLLFGGAPDLAPPLGDTWAWDGTTWTELAPATAPDARRDAAITADPITGRLLLLGGISAAGYDPKTWQWLDGTWRELSTATAPPRRGFAAMAFDALAGEAILFGGNRPDAFDLRQAWALRLGSPYPDEVYPGEACERAVDDDGDGAAGCDDVDCWGRCAPGCAPALAACETPATALGCGDGVCELAREVGDLCAADCDVCGDGVCAPFFEDVGSCADDCQPCGDGTCGPGETLASCPGDCG